MRRLLLAASCLALCNSLPVSAAEYSAGDGCSTAGAYHEKNDATGAYHLVCTGSVWKLATFYKADGRIGFGTSNITPSNASIVVGGSDSNLFIGAGGSDGDIFLSNSSGVNRIHIDADGNSYSASIKTYISGETSSFFNAGNVGILNTAPNAALDVTGDIEYTGVITDVSDRRMKTDIAPLGGQLDAIAALRPVSFAMKDDPNGRRELGFIAQEVKPVYPELVGTSPDGIKSLNYVGMIAPLVQAVQELKAENEALRAANARLSQRMDVLEGKVRPPLTPYNQ